MRRMTSTILYRAAAVLLALGAIGHTLGGMLGTARKGAQAGPEADRVLADMKTVRFAWNGAQCTWHGFWMGNGLGVSALLLPVVVALWTLGATAPGDAGPWLVLAWTLTLSLVLLTVLGVRYFAVRVGAVFGLVAALSAAGAFLLTAG
jgi:hypothetical protein